MTGEAGWRSAGRWSAWMYGVGALLGGALAAVVSSGIPPVDPNPAAHYAYVRGIWPELYAAFLLLLAAFLALVPLGLALRERLGSDGPRPDLISAAFLIAAIVGTLWMLMQIGTAQAIVRESSNLDAAGLKTMESGATVWSAVINWMQRGFLLPASLGTYWASRLALRSRRLPRGLAWLGLMLSAFYWLGLASLLVRDAGLDLPDAAGSVLILLGSLLASAWALWLGFELGRPAAAP